MIRQKVESGKRRVLFHLLDLILHLRLSKLLETLLVLSSLLDGLLDAAFVVLDSHLRTSKVGAASVRVVGSD